MPLTGQAKTDYQREYMHKRRSNTRSNTRSNIEPVSVRPVTPKAVRPKPAAYPFGNDRPAGLSDNQWAYIQMKAEE